MMVPYHTVDVFTDRPFGGNQLAVIPDARRLDAATMQSIAAEFGYAETTFVLPPRDAAHTAHVRIFTPRAELPFAGHPNIGTAFALARLGAVFGQKIGSSLVFEEAAGLVPLDITYRDGEPTGATLTAPRPFARLGETTADVIAACVGLTEFDVMTAHHEPCAASVGMPFVFAELRDAAAVSRCVPDSAKIKASVPISGAEGIFVYARTAERNVRCRMFAPTLGVTEDAATGSAGVALVALLADLAPTRELSLEIDISQGIEMGRPSQLCASAFKADNRVQWARIGGPCVPVMQGHLQLPKH